MKHHLAHLRYTLEHKWYVFLECRKYGLIWEGIVHDLSKFTPSEWDYYVGYFFRKDIPYEVFKETGWKHHYQHNPHHWEYWNLSCPTLGDDIALYMPEKCMKEMVADWKGAAKAKRTGTAKDWYLQNRDRINLHPRTREFVEKELGCDQ